MARKSQYFTALVTVDKTYDRHSHVWRLTLHVQSASGLPYDVRTLYTRRRDCKHIKPGEVYKAFGWFQRNDCNECTLDWLAFFPHLLQSFKTALKWRRENAVNVSEC